MNKNFVLVLALAGSTLIGVTGCGDDTQTVDPDPKFSYTANQKFTYESTPRDQSQAPMPADKRTVKWTVIETGVNIGGRDGATRIKQEMMAADGATVESTDTLIFAAEADGEFYQYDVIGSIVRRIPLAAIIANDLPKTWTKVGDTKNTSTLDYIATAESTILIPIPNTTLSAKVTYSVLGQHKGKGSVTVPAKTEANAFTTDLIVKLKATDGSGFVPITNDSLRMSYSFNVTDGLLRQALESKTIQFTNPATLQPEPQAIAGFDFVLKSKP